MYDENSMRSHIFWIKFRRVFLLLLFTLIGTALGVVISDYIVNILMFHQNFRILIVSISAVIFLSISMLLTANTGKEIEDGYWKIAVYKKLAVISKKLDNLENPNSTKPQKNENKNHTENTAEKDEKQIIEETSIQQESSPSVIQEIKENIPEISNELKTELPATVVSSNTEIIDNEISSKKEETV